jgi:hypothetical protein
MPRGRLRSCFLFAVPDYRSDNQLGVLRGAEPTVVAVVDRTSYLRQSSGSVSTVDLGSHLSGNRRVVQKQSDVGFQGSPPTELRHFSQ